MAIDSGKLWGEARAAFASGGVFNTTEDQLRQYIQGIALHAVFNVGIQHQAAVMASAITQIQMSRLIEKINRQNSRITWFFIVVAVLSFLSSVIQILVALGAIHR